MLIYDDICWLSLDRLGWYNIPCFDKAHVLPHFAHFHSFPAAGKLCWMASCVLDTKSKISIVWRRTSTWDPEIDDWLVVFKPSQHVRVISTNHPKVLRWRKAWYFWKIPSEMNWDRAGCTFPKSLANSSTLGHRPYTALLFTSPTADRNVVPLSCKLVHLNPSNYIPCKWMCIILIIYYCMYIYIIYRHVSGINPIISRPYLS